MVQITAVLTYHTYTLLIRLIIYSMFVVFEVFNMDTLSNPVEAAVH